MREANPGCLPRIPEKPGSVLKVLGLYGVLVVFYYLIFCTIPRDSDNAGNFLAGVDWLRGNWNLKNWVLPPDNFLNSDLLLYGLLSKLFGVRIEVCYYSAALIWAGVVLVAVHLTRLTTTGSQRLYATLGIFTVLGLPIIHGNQELQLVSFSPYHIGSVLYLLVAFKLALAYLERGSAWTLCGYFVLMALDCFGDPMMVFLGALPITAALLYRLLVTGGRNSRILRLSAASVGSVLCGKLLVNLVRHWGFHSTPVPVEFTLFPDFSRNLGIVCHGSFIFAGAEFWGQQIRLENFVSVLVLLFHLPLLGFQVCFFAQETKAHYSALDSALEKGELKPQSTSETALSIAYFVTLFNLGAGLFSATVQDLQHIRYLIPGFVFFNVLLAARACHRVLYRHYIKACFLVSLVYTVGVYLPRITAGPVGGRPEQNQAVSRLLELGVKDGFGHYWDATLISVWSRGEIFMRPIVPDVENRLHSYTWTSSVDWFQPDSLRGERFFVLTRSEGTKGFISKEQALTHFGQVQEEISLPPWTILVFRTDQNREQLEAFHEEAKATFRALK
jgi:hypothetical protein